MPVQLIVIDTVHKDTGVQPMMILNNFIIRIHDKYSIHQQISSR